MRKFWAVVRREYKKVVLRWAFAISTLIAPLMASFFGIVPMLIFSVKSDVQRIIVVDHSGQVAPRLRANLLPEKIEEKAKQSADNNVQNANVSQQDKMKRGAGQTGETFAFIDYNSDGKSPEQIRRELTGEIQQNDLDSYLIIPENIDEENTKYEFYSRKSGDFVTNSALEDALNDAVRSARLAKAKISEDELKKLSQKIDLDVNKVSEQGEEEDKGGGFGAAFIIGLLIYITLAIYGQMIMGAVIEEKETRIAEILFSSASPLELMLGKLVGVGLAGLTQLAIWIFSALILFAFGAAQLSAAGIPLSMPNITPFSLILFFVFFLLGYFIFATIYALIGSMVTTVQEGGQFAFIPVIVLLISFYSIFPIARDPNSTFAFWVSIAPFLAPLTMPVRVAVEMPPLWQILVSILVNSIAIFGLIWLAARVYRVGMLMSGKRATIPEVWKWIRQS